MRSGQHNWQQQRGKFTFFEMFLCQKFKLKTKKGDQTCPKPKSPSSPLTQTLTDIRFLTGSLTLSFLSGNTALQVRSSSSWSSRTGRTQLDRSIWTERESETGSRSRNPQICCCLV